MFINLYSHAEVKPNLVLLPLEVSESDIDLESEYGSALQSGLKERYKVFYGAAVERELEREYSKIDCDTEKCNQNVALAFNGELVADASVKKIKGGYILKLVINNVLTNEIIESPAIPCRACDSFSVLDALKQVGAGKPFNPSVGVISQGGPAKPTPTPTPKQVAIDSRAILIFDSQPSGAEVYINQERVGTTPYQGLSHNLGERLSIDIKDTDHRPYQMQVTLNQAITQLESIKLEAGQAFLTVATKPFDPNAMVYINGQAKGKAPLQVEVSTKTLEIYAQSGQKKTGVKNLKLPHGANEQLRLLFKDKKVNDLALIVSKYLGVQSATQLDGANFCIQAGSISQLAIADYFREHRMRYIAITFDTFDQILAGFKSGRCDFLSVTQARLGEVESRLDMSGHVVLPERL